MLEWYEPGAVVYGEQSHVRQALESLRSKTRVFKPKCPQDLLLTDDYSLACGRRVTRDAYLFLLGQVPGLRKLFLSCAASGKLSREIWNSLLLSVLTQHWAKLSKLSAYESDNVVDGFGRPGRHVPLGRIFDVFPDVSPTFLRARGRELQAFFPLVTCEQRCTLGYWVEATEQGMSRWVCCRALQTPGGVAVADQQSGGVMTLRHRAVHQRIFDAQPLSWGQSQISALRESLQNARNCEEHADSYVYWSKRLAIPQAEVRCLFSAATRRGTPLTRFELLDRLLTRRPSDTLRWDRDVVRQRVFQAFSFS